MGIQECNYSFPGSIVLDPGNLCKMPSHKIGLWGQPFALVRASDALKVGVGYRAWLAFNENEINTLLLFWGKGIFLLGG